MDPVAATVLAPAIIAAAASAQVLLRRICLPVATEFGLLLRDQASAWRAEHFISTLQTLEKKLVANKVPEGAHAHPRLVHTILEQGSWADDSAVQEMWAGLLASSCTAEGDDDSNLIFVNLLGQLTRLQARVLNYACVNARKVVSPAGLLLSHPLTLQLEKLCEVAGEKDLDRLGREIARLRDSGLVWQRGDLSSYVPPSAGITPSPLALHMYVRCQGSRASALEFFGLTPPQQAAPWAPASASPAGPPAQAPQSTTGAPGSPAPPQQPS